MFPIDESADIFLCFFFKPFPHLYPQLPGLFDGCQFFFQGNFEYPTPEKSELIQLVKSGGGTILNREPKINNIDESDLTVPYHAGEESPLRNCCFFIVHDNTDRREPVRKETLCTVPASWLMSCMATFSLVELP